MPVKLTLGLLGALLSLGLTGCGPSLEEQTREQGTVLDAPSRHDFPDVGNALQLRCATLDCHGQAGRNMRLYGFGGLRLAAADSPIGNPTTELEFDASYDSVVALEPEVISAVVAGRSDPNQLSMVRKARGIEHHKGGQLALIGDSLDRCLVLWLTAKFDPIPCGDVIDAPHPHPKTQ